MVNERLESVADSLGLAQAPDSADALRKDIRAEMRDLHPDRNGGDFATQKDRERFTALSDALAELDGNTAATSLVPVETVAPMVTAILEALGNAGQLEARENSAVKKREAIRLEAKDEAAYRFRLSRYTSGTVGLVASTVWLVPTVLNAMAADGASAVLQASILAPMFAHALFEPISFGLALYAWMFFALTWFMEQNDRSRIDWVTTDAARNALMHRAISQARVRGEQDTVTKADLRDAVGRRFRPILPLRLLGVRDVSSSFLDRVVGHHVEELTAQGVLTPADEASLSPRYKIAESVTTELNLGLM